MKTLQFNQPHILNKLHDELIAAQLSPLAIQGISEADRAEITLLYPDDLTEQQQQAIVAVVEQHDPNPIPDPNWLAFRAATVSDAGFRRVLGAANPFMLVAVSEALSSPNPAIQSILYYWNLLIMLLSPENLPTAAEIEQWNQLSADFNLPFVFISDGRITL